MFYNNLTYPKTGIATAILEAYTPVPQGANFLSRVQRTNMSLTTPELEFPPGQPLSYASIALQDELLEELERLVKRSHFRNSKRYPAVLKFIVSETLEGRGSL